MKANFEVAAPFQKIQAASRLTGLSTYFLRRGCRDGSIPCVRSGQTYMVNVPALLKQLGVYSQEGGTAADA